MTGGRRGDTPYTQTWAGQRLQVWQLPQPRVLREGMGSLLMSERSFLQFPAVEVPLMNSNILVIHETILILSEKMNTGAGKSTVVEHEL